jgi:hypothetical protein
MGQEESPAVRIVTDPVFDAAQEGQKGGLESILKEYGQIKAFCPDLSDNMDDFKEIFLESVPPVVRDDAVYGRVVFQEGDNPGPCQDSYIGIREIRPDRLEGRHGHHRISHPVCGSDQDSTDL